VVSLELQEIANTTGYAQLMGTIDKLAANEAEFVGARLERGEHQQAAWAQAKHNAFKAVVQLMAKARQEAKKHGTG
jgi:hypothetical protein